MNKAGPNVTIVWGDRIIVETTATIVIVLIIFCVRSLVASAYNSSSVNS